jgi:hypothetical protein
VVHTAFLKWNFNHGMSIARQLSEGIRWFHLKVCWVESRASVAMSLNDVYHQHRGFTAQSLEYILSEMIGFLDDHPNGAESGRLFVVFQSSALCPEPVLAAFMQLTETHVFSFSRRISGHWHEQPPQFR